MNIVELKFADKALHRGGLMLFSREHALEFVNQCRVENIGVLGVDSFIVRGEMVQPSMENTIDLSWSSHDYEKALEFIRTRGAEFHFEITTDQ